MSSQEPRATIERRWECAHCQEVIVDSDLWRRGQGCTCPRVTLPDGTKVDAKSRLDAYRKVVAWSRRHAMCVNVIQVPEITWRMMLPNGTP